MVEEVVFSLGRVRDEWEGSTPRGNVRVGRGHVGVGGRRGTGVMGKVWVVNGGGVETSTIQEVVLGGTEDGPGGPT